MATAVVSGIDTPVGYEQITSLSSAESLTVPKNARWALIIPETQAVRWRDDGTDPSATVGMPLAVGQPLQYTGSLAGIRFIEQTASAKINIAYYA
jgi:hypothetical protein